MEQAIRRLSSVYGYNFSIIRVGALQPAKAGEESFVLEPSDTLTVRPETKASLAPLASA